MMMTSEEVSNVSGYFFYSNSHPEVIGRLEKRRAES
jgi:hypothetical protein